MPPHPPGDIVRAVWSLAGDGYPAYQPVLPGDPSFICQPDLCDAWCCRQLTVPVGESDAARLTTLSGRPLRDLVESEDGEPLRLPLADPYVLARTDGHCAHLAPDCRCAVYEARPAACRLYPHQFILLDAGTGRPRHATDPPAALEALIVGERCPLIPVLVRHLPCPGFTGPPLDEAAWTALARETIALQFSGR